MTKLTHYVPNLFTHFFDDLDAPGFLIKPLHGKPLNASFKVDIKETPTEFNIHAQIPGVKKEDIHISVDGGMVTIQAESKQHDQKTVDEKVVQSECYYGTVSRSFQLPADVVSDSAQAIYENGVLNLTLPKKVSSTSQRIAVK